MISDGIQRTLVTTADKRAWPDNAPVLMLGEWCLDYKEKYKSNSKIDYVVADPYGISEQQKTTDQDYINNLSQVMIIELSEALNKYHETNYSTRYWNILVGHWLQFHIKVVFNRYKSLEYALSNYSVTETVELQSSAHNLTSYDTFGFISNVNNDCWNNKLYIEILKYFTDSNLNITVNNVEDDVSEIAHNNKIGYKRHLKNIVIKALSLSPIFARKTDAVIVNSYLSKIDEIKLYLSLKQVPCYYHEKISYRINIEPLKREKFFCNNKGYFGVELVIRSLVNMLIPVCYLEGYTYLNNSRNKRWPVEPKFIFTSNDFLYKETFKFWVAQKSEQGVPYYVGQHGSNYGTLKGSEIWPEITTSDKFISWGWEKGYEGTRILPAFNLNVANQKQKYNKNGGLLLVERGPGHLHGPQDRHYEHILYQEYVFKFFEKVIDKIKNKTTIRLHHGSQDHETSDMFLWKTKYPNADIDNFSLPLTKLIQRSRLVVFSYECAGFLECMALNVPTMCFWRGGLGHLYKDAAEHYKMLKVVGIVTNDAEEAASYINMYWEDVDAWWDSDLVQEARIKFCQEYSRVVQQPVKLLSSMLLNDKVR